MLYANEDTMKLDDRQSILEEILKTLKNPSDNKILIDSSFKPAPNPSTGEGVEKARGWLERHTVRHKKVGHGIPAMFIAERVGVSRRELILAVESLGIFVSKDGLVAVKLEEKRLSDLENTLVVYEAIKNINACCYSFETIIEKHIRRCLYKSDKTSKKFYRVYLRLVNQAYISFDISNWWNTQSEKGFYGKVGGPHVFYNMPYKLWSDDMTTRDSFLDEKIAEYNSTKYNKQQYLRDEDRSMILDLLGEVLWHAQQASTVLTTANKHPYLKSARKVLGKFISRMIGLRTYVA